MPAPKEAGQGRQVLPVQGVQVVIVPVATNVAAQKVSLEKTGERHPCQRGRAILVQIYGNESD